MMIVVVAIFMICWLPYHLYFTVFMRIFNQMDPLTALYIYLNMYWLAMSSTIVNPIIYCWMNSRYVVFSLLRVARLIGDLCHLGLTKSVTDFIGYMTHLYMYFQVSN